MPQSPHRLRHDLKCVEWDVRSYYTHRPPQWSGGNMLVCVPGSNRTSPHLMIFFAVFDV